MQYWHHGSNERSDSASAGDLLNHAIRMHLPPSWSAYLYVCATGGYTEQVTAVKYNQPSSV